MMVNDWENVYGARIVCNPQFNGFANVWVDKPEAQDMVAVAIKDINVRYTLEDCIDMPEQSITMYVDLPKDIRSLQHIGRRLVLYTKTGTVNAPLAKVKSRSYALGSLR